MINDSLTALSALQRNLSPLGTVNAFWNSAVTAGYTRFDGLGVLEKTEMLSASTAAQTAIAAMCAPKFPYEGINAGGAFDHTLLGRSWFPLLDDAQKMIPSFAGVNAIKDCMAMKTFAGLDTFGKMQSLLGPSVHSAVQQAIGSMDRIDELRDLFAIKAPIGLGALGNIPQPIGVLASQQLALSTPHMLGIDAFKESMGFRVSAINTALGAIRQSGFLPDTDSLAKTISAMSATNMFRDSIIAFNQKDVFEQALAHFSATAHAQQMQEAIDDAELNGGIALFESAIRDYIDKFKRLHPTMQMVIISVFLHFISPQLNNVFSTFVSEPLIEKIIQSAKLSPDQVKAYKKVPAAQGVDTTNLRFIVKNNIRLRAKASTKSESLNELVIGQVVTVLSKKKNWAEVVYTYDDSQVFHGWVLLTYTAKFKQGGAQR